MYINTSKLKALMKKRRITQQEIAKATGMSQSAVSNMLNGNAVPKKELVAKLAEQLSCSVDDLCSDLVDDRFLACACCGSNAVTFWHNYGSGKHRIKCEYCNADSGEQSTAEKAQEIFLSFKHADSITRIHVLSREELLDFSFYDDNDVRPVWFENRGLFIVPALLQNGLMERQNGNVRVEWHGSFGAKSFIMEQYGSWWRCWSAKPTQAQSDAEQWLGG